MSTDGPSLPARRHDGHTPVDLRPVHELTARLWSPDSRWHVGDVAWAWATARHGGADRPSAWWERDGAPVAWAWVEPPGELSCLVDPAHPGLADEVLAWFDTLHVPGDREITVVRTEKPLSEALPRHGYREVDGPYFEHLVRDLDHLPAEPVRTGFRLRPVDPYSDADVSRRAAAHRAAFDHLVWDGNPAPVTGLTVRAVEPGAADDVTRRAAYRRVMASWPYRPDLDLVVETRDGLVVSYCLLWLDEANRVGLLEPVGTDPEFRRLGLARAVCLAGLHALRAAGANRALVCPRGDARYPVPGRLYRELGFTPHTRTVTWRRDR